MGDLEVGLIGVSQAFRELAQSYESLSDEEAGLVLVRKLRESNYIPNSAEAEYSRALFREFQRFMGDLDQEDSERGLSIKVLGPGCAQCNRLEQTVMRVLSDWIVIPGMWCGDFMNLRAAYVVWLSGCNAHNRAGAVAPMQTINRVGNYNNNLKKGCLICLETVVLPIRTR